MYTPDLTWYKGTKLQDKI